MRWPGIKQTGGLQEFEGQKSRKVPEGWSGQDLPPRKMKLKKTTNGKGRKERYWEGGGKE